jgi:hypothetical protein
VALGRRPISRDPRSLSILPLEATRIGETMPRNVAYKLIEESASPKQSAKQTVNGKVR